MTSDIMSPGLPETDTPTAVAGFLTTQGVSRSQLESLLALSDQFRDVLARPVPKVPALQGKTVANLFFENSTRTRISFEKAARSLSADIINFSGSGSALSKGESLRDTAHTLHAIGSDLMVVRHAAAGAPQLIAEWTGLPVINAGDGAHQHPTQALLDAFTIRRRFGQLDGLKIAIVGDIRSSRVARSNLFAFTTLGAEVVMVSPKTLQPVTTEGWPAAFTDRFDEVIREMDVVYLLRIQAERGGMSQLPSLPEYAVRFGLSLQRFAAMKPESVVLHPGPMNRGVEIDHQVIGDERALMTDQVEAGVAVRMAVLFRLLAGGT